MQAEGEGVLLLPEYQPLHQGLWSRQSAALERASPAATAAAAEAREAAAKDLQDLPDQPSWVPLCPSYHIGCPSVTVPGAPKTINVSASNVREVVADG